MSRGSMETAASVVLSVLAGILGVLGWAFSNFETSESATRSREMIEHRLERIEAKLDRLSEFRQR